MTIRFDANRKYFNPVSWVLPAIICLVGAILLAASVTTAGALAMLAAALLFGIQFAGRANAESLDRQCAEAVQDVKEKAVRKFMLDEDEVSEVDPIVLSGYQIEDLWLQPLFKMENGQFRTSNYDGVVIMFSSEQIYYYKYSFSLVSDKHNEVAHELFYDDITSIETNISTCTKYEGSRKHEIKYNNFVLKTKGGNEFRTSFKDSDAVERSIIGMKQLVRERKRSNK